MPGSRVGGTLFHSMNASTSSSLVSPPTVFRISYAYRMCQSFDKYLSSLLDQWGKACCWTRASLLDHKKPEVWLFTGEEGEEARLGNELHVPVLDSIMDLLHKVACKKPKAVTNKFFLTVSTLSHQSQSPMLSILKLRTSERREYLWSFAQTQQNCSKIELRSYLNRLAQCK